MLHRNLILRDLQPSTFSRSRKLACLLVCRKLPPSLLRITHSRRRRQASGDGGDEDEASNPGCGVLQSHVWLRGQLQDGPWLLQVCWHRLVLRTKGVTHLGVIQGANLPTIPLFAPEDVHSSASKCTRLSRALQHPLIAWTVVEALFHLEVCACQGLGHCVPLAAHNDDGQEAHVSLKAPPEQQLAHLRGRCGRGLPALGTDGALRLVGAGSVHLHYSQPALLPVVFCPNLLLHQFPFLGLRL
mmetsp:Transcript_81341/g.225203  ORF Transcript_81341/g.225203 Transcript_81341/m.225203 type:complete len:243 (-) Transcript_81341:359-1087(-)